ncbi:MAG: tryptophan synthase subunit alpha [Myxococcota bacterium]
MRRLRGAFGRRKALVTYLMAGDGDTVGHALACAKAGADVIELGFPFSDPIADGPVIQRAAQRSLAAGTTLPRTLALAAELRRHTDVPVVLMGYLNPVLSFGVERFVERCAAAGVDGLIIPDLPPEEAGTLRAAAAANDVGLTFLLAPTSTPARERAVLEASTGFVYFVSVTGVTGARAALPDCERQVTRLRAATDTPVAIGFGISDATQARALGAFADGVIVGSALVQRIASGEPLAPFVTSLRTALEDAC